MEGLSKMLIPVMCLFLISYFSYHGLEGRYGLYAQKNLRVELTSLEVEHNRLQKRKQQIEHRISLLKPESISRDLLDELARKVLNLSHENDSILWSDEKK